MNALVAAVASRCEALVEGLRLDDPNAPDRSVQIPVYVHALPIAETGEDKAEQSPSLVVRLAAMEEHDGRVATTIHIHGELFTEGGVEDGMAALLALVDRLRPLCRRGPGNVPGYKLLPPVVWRIGDKETGNQPHPFYQFQATLRFAGAERTP